MERILVAVDFSDASQHALRVAFDLGRALGASLRVVYVMPCSIPGHGIGPPLFTPSRQQMEAQLASFVLELLEPGDEAMAESDWTVRQGLEYAQILEEAEQFEATLLVLGSYGRSAVGRFFLGSVSSEVLAHAELPVFVVHASGRGRPARILAAVERDRSSGSVLSTAAALRFALGAELVVAHVMDETTVAERSGVRYEQEREDLRAAVEHAFPAESRPQIVFRAGRPVAELCAEAEAGAYDLVVLGTHERHSAFDLTNTTARILHRCPCSVLVVRPVVQPTAAPWAPGGR